MTWWERAACAGVNPDVFHPSTSRGNRGVVDADLAAYALSFCAACEVRAECLADALATEGPDDALGIRGGMLPQDRRAATRRRRAAVAVCGTDGGYAAHLRRREPTCQSCRDAHAERWRSRPPRRLRTRPNEEKI